MDTRPVGKLTLRTYDILQNNTITDTDNSIGTISTNGQLITFKDVNMKLVLGSLYEKYDKFNMKMTAFSHRPPTTNLTNTHTCLVMLRGLRSESGGYNHTNRNLRNEIVLGLVPLKSGGSGTNMAFFEVITTITKPSEVETLVIEFRNNSTQVVNGLNEKINQSIGHITIMLEFCGVDE